MDLEHPAISRTLKEGYPDDAGKPQYKNNIHPDYNRVKEDTQMKIEEMTVKQLLDMGAELDVYFFNAKSKEEAEKLINNKAFENLSLPTWYENRGKNEDTNWVKVQNDDDSVEVSVFYEEVSNE